jgi:hypothetical protein
MGKKTTHKYPSLNEIAELRNQTDPPRHLREVATILDIPRSSLFEWLQREKKRRGVVEVVGYR